MTEGIVELRNALVEAVAARKLIEDKLAKSRTELDKWRKRSREAEQFDAEKEIEERIRQLELTIAEFEAERMAQEDREKELLKTLKRLENAVPHPKMPDLSHIDDADETIKRMENRILESEAYAELSDNRKDRKLEEDANELSLDDELEALKKSVKKKPDDR